MKAFIVSVKDVLNKAKNPSLSLSPRELLLNKKVKKVYVKKKSK